MVVVGGASRPPGDIDPTRNPSTPLPHPVRISASSSIIGPLPSLSSTLTFPQPVGVRHDAALALAAPRQHQAGRHAGAHRPEQRLRVHGDGGACALACVLWIRPPPLLLGRGIGAAGRFDAPLALTADALPVWLCGGVLGKRVSHERCVSRGRARVDPKKTLGRRPRWPYLIRMMKRARRPLQIEQLSLSSLWRRCSAATLRQSMLPRILFSEVFVVVLTPSLLPPFHLNAYTQAGTQKGGSIKAVSVGPLTNFRPSIAKRDTRTKARSTQHTYQRSGAHAQTSHTEQSRGRWRRRRCVRSSGKCADGCVRLIDGRTGRSIESTGRAPWLAGH